MTRFTTARQEIVDMCRHLSDHGYFAGTGGNIGVRLDDRLMAVTPSATDYYTMTAADVPILEIATLSVVAGEKTPTVEKALHSTMLQAHPSRYASIHTHQPIASAVALLHEMLPWAPGCDLTALGPHVALVPYRPSGTSMLAKAFARTIRPDVYAYLMASHGVICAANDLKSAASMLRQIEASAALYLRKLIQNRSTLDKQVRTFLLNVLDKTESQGA
ncbi:class II aldolase/adducin family protein [Rhizobium sp. AG855]|uniref:class II aldolase/adducin family protein n=1 Tax=Rhizobium sp. AG855 TaxID=2183898 RepID=UPI000E715F97|nr:class II aldolase/adducin family protein [Rhizobium sp. AG855]RKE79206.1 L-fuculose-phosphate aldolase [Rhizobium sp. AG855]